MQVHLRALGCRLNEAELESWARALRAHGLGVTSSPDDADLVVVNTCAVTAEAARKSRQLLRRSHRENPRAKLVVTGCYATLDAERVGALDGVDLVVPNTDKDRLVERIVARLDREAMPALATEPGEAALFALGRNRAFVKVQDGCRYRCTFCIVTVARGEERSRPLDEIVDEIRVLVGQGVREVVLTGVHVGGYGSDTGSSLRDLIAAVLQRTEVPRLRLASLEPWDLPDDFFDLFADRRLMPHVHLPLQSGCDSVLRRMSRRCRTGDFERLVERARAAVPDLNVTTDLIAGFPGETEDEWAETLAFVERIGFGHLHVFPYSPRAGTKAAGLAGQVPEAVRRERVRALHALGARMKRALLVRHLGREMPVLWEQARRAPEGGLRHAGYTPNFLRVETAAMPGADIANQILPARLAEVAADGETLLAAPHHPAR
ncbi:MAG: tRNA (N(6)-L-threonylcarbamoyladenosine(37)-C(2))-methylthiotransferase MtaB [Chromatiales bacterium]|nr:tRNA (N(6)-L-threonylcarbamoyladenosine(37)-C(2))-methylthiotransferase MtaB [Chromatiales bacterium]